MIEVTIDCFAVAKKKKLLASLVFLLRFVVRLAIMQTVFSMFNVWSVLIPLGVTQPQ